MCAAAAGVLALAACGDEGDTWPGAATGTGLPQGSEPVELDPASFTANTAEFVGGKIKTEAGSWEAWPTVRFQESSFRPTRPTT